MSRDPVPPPEEPPPDPEPAGRLRPSPPGLLVPAGLLALVAGWAVRPLSLRTGRIAPDVPGLSIALIFFAAAVVVLTAYFTWRTVRRARPDLEAHHAVNRLVLGKASAVVGALVVGGYAGNAIAHLGVGGDHAQSQIWLSLAAAAGGVGLLVAGLLLERACRVPGEPR